MVKSYLDTYQFYGKKFFRYIYFRNSLFFQANNTHESVNVVLQESILVTGSQDDNSTLWGKCSQDPVTCDIEHFYVGALVPPLSISKSVPGENIHRLSSIPGRENSLIKKDTTPAKVYNSKKKEQVIQLCILLACKNIVSMYDKIFKLYNKFLIMQIFV